MFRRVYRTLTRSESSPLIEGIHMSLTEKMPLMPDIAWAHNRKRVTQHLEECKYHKVIEGADAIAKLLDNLEFNLAEKYFAISRADG